MSWIPFSAPQFIEGFLDARGPALPTVIQRRQSFSEYVKGEVPGRSQARTVPDGVERGSMMPDDAVRAYVQQPRSVVVALTHDPKLDDMALFDALQSPAFYVGALGSQLNSERRYQRGALAVQGPLLTRR